MITEKFNVLWINVNDELQADIKKYFDETNQFLYNCKEKNEKVLVHCQMGISRSSSIVLAYLMK
jgi:protein-tyrosine phosphatase